jgi:DhnA family fructose-bisphosphate aldolase class Ia
MQRGGVAGVAGEIEDRFGSYTPQSIERYGLDGGKMMFRVVPDDERSLRTIDYCSGAVTELSRRGLAAFVEPLPMRRGETAYAADFSVETLVKYVGVAAGLGETSAYTWLKIPHVDGFTQVASATTLPILMLGGESIGDPSPLIRRFVDGMKAGGNVRGVMVGRNVSFPGSLDPGVVAAAVATAVHDGATAEDAIEIVRGGAPASLALDSYLSQGLRSLEG